MNARAIPPSRLWWLTAGFGVWCFALVILYALHALGCGFAWPAGTLRLGLILVLLAHLVAIGWLWRGLARADADPAYGEPGAFLHTVAVWTVIAAFVTTALSFGPVLLLSTCL